MIFRRNKFINQTLADQGLTFINFEGKVRVEIADNYYEGVYHLGQGFPLMYVYGDSLLVRNNTFSKSTLGSGIQLTSASSLVVQGIRFTNISGPACKFLAR